MNVMPSSSKVYYILILPICAIFMSPNPQRYGTLLHNIQINPSLKANPICFKNTSILHSGDIHRHNHMTATIF